MYLRPVFCSLTSAVEFGEGGKVSFHPCGFLKRGKANVMQAISRLLISPTATCLYWKLFGVFFFLSFPLLSLETLASESSNPLYSLVLHSAAQVLLCVDKSLWEHASLICPTREDVDGLAGRCRCLLLSLDIAPTETHPRHPRPRTLHESPVCRRTAVSSSQACLKNSVD